jgi:hypothetical protein
LTAGGGAGYARLVIGAFSGIKRLALGAGVMVSLVCACVGDDSTGADASSDACSIGNEGCPCTSGGACNPGLACRSNFCVNLGDDGGPDANLDAGADATDAADAADATDATDAGCVPNGATCTTSGECCSGFCNGICQTSVTD